MNKKEMLRETKHIKGLGKVLEKLANEVEKKGRFDDDDLELLKKIGSNLLFKGAAISYKD